MLVRLLGGEKKEGSGLSGVSILPTYVEREAVPIRPQLITRPVNRRQGSTGRVRQELDRKVDTLLSRAAPRCIHFCPLRLFFFSLFSPLMAAGEPWHGGCGGQIQAKYDRVSGVARTTTASLAGVHVEPSTTATY